MNESAQRHTPQGRDQEYESELRSLKTSLLGMGGRVEQMIGQATRALLHRDAVGGAAVRKADRLVNDAEIEIDSMVLRILALRQPTSSDLRLLTRALKMVTDIERIGDLAVNLGKLAIDLSELTTPEMTVHPAIERMAGLVRKMIADALDAFVEGDTALARKVIAGDDDVDELHDQVFEEMLLSMMGKTTGVAIGIRVQEAGRLLERMGDHATNLAEQVVFLVHAEDIRHPPKPDEA